jgi:hypothetical protein
VTESSAQNMIEAAVTIGAGDKTVQVPWSGGSVGFEAARFASPAEFLVVRYVAGATGGGHEWTYAVFDLRASAATSSAKNPIVLGPFDLPAGVVELNFCPDAGGRLVLLWSGYPSSATGRNAAVYRTDIDALTASQALVSVDSPTATGVIACKVETTPAPGLLAIYDDALVQPAGVSLPTPAQPAIASQPAPKPGLLKLSARTLDLAATQGVATFGISNQGQDVLEVTGITKTGSAISVMPNVALPVCLKPNEMLSVSVIRLTTNAAASTITVNTAPASPAGANTVAVTLEKLVPDPKATVVPAMLTWKTGQADPRNVVVKNTGNVPLAIGFSALAAGSPFTLTDTPTDLAPGASTTAKVAPPAACAGGQVSGSFKVGAVLSPVTGMSPPMIAGFPVTVQLTGCVPIQVKVPPGALRITTIQADAPGDDVMPSGPLDLTGCQVQDRVISAAGVPGGFRRPFFTFGPTAFGADSTLPPGRVVRVLTRAKAAGEADRPFVVFAGFKSAVWNNTGDTGRILDENGILVAEQTYVTSLPAPGNALPPGTVYTPPRARTRALVRRVYVDAQMDWTNVFEIVDGDLVTITATGSARFSLLGGQVGPSGAPGPLTPADQGWPLEAAPPFALIGSLEGVRPFLVGSTASLTFNGNFIRPMMLTLGPNDGELWDNAGQFDCVAVLYR